MQDENAILEAYLDTLLTEGKEPASVYAFCKSLDISEAVFYERFPSFDGVEARLWEKLFEQALESLEADEDYANLSGRQKMLALFYAIFEQMPARRSYLLMRFPGFGKCEGMGRLEAFKKRFESHTGEILEEAAGNGEIVRRGRLNEGYPYLFYMSFLFILDYHLKDASQGFERTDALVEKSVNLLFDMLEQQVVESAFDIARFLMQKEHA